MAIILCLKIFDLSVSQSATSTLISNTDLLLLTHQCTLTGSFTIGYCGVFETLRD
jgi:hypothetical protein